MNESCSKPLSEKIRGMILRHAEGDIVKLFLLREVSDSKNDRNVKMIKAIRFIE